MTGRPTREEQSRTDSDQTPRRSHPMNDQGNFDIRGNRLHRSTLSRRRFLTNSGAVLSGGALALATPYIGTAAAAEPVRIRMGLAKHGAIGPHGADPAAR